MNKRDILKIVITFLLTLHLYSINIQVRAFDHPDYSRFVIESAVPLKYNFTQNPTTLEIEIQQPVDFSPRQIEFKNSRILKKLTFRSEQNRSLFILETRSEFKIRRSFLLEKPFRIVFDLLGDPRPKTEAPVIAEEKNISSNLLQQKEKTEEKIAESEAPPVIQEQEPRKLYQKPIELICIDPGHGGEDYGAVGTSKTYEKDITLDISLRLKKLLEDRLGIRTILTRDKDVDLPLNNRAAIANNQNAQIFISIHVNSSFRKSAKGAETYFVSLKATDEEAQQLAIKENAKSQLEEEQLPDDNLQLILWNMIQTEYIKESSKLAEFVQEELNRNLKTLNRGVKQAPFRVLMRVAMPAILVEVGFLSNSEEEKSLKESTHLQKIALAIYSGISRFVSYYRENILK